MLNGCGRDPCVESAWWTRAPAHSTKPRMRGCSTRTVPGSGS
jgi:hypothetical protein